MPARFAITTFNIDRFMDMGSFLNEYERIGVDRLELNGRVSSQVLDQLLPLIDRGVVTVASVHNCCPRIEPPGQPEPALSSPDEGVRKLAVGYAERSIETACRVGAKAVVLHPGTVPGLEALEQPVVGLFRAGGAGGSGFAAARARFAEERRRLHAQHLHDCTGLDDHKVPGKGNVDFPALVPYLRDATLRVLEYGRRIQPLERIAGGIAFLQRAGVL